MNVSVIIPVYNNWSLTLACLRSLAECSPPGLEVIVVDNGSTDATAHDCPEIGRQLFGENFIFSRHEENRNFAPACNVGAHLATGDFLFFLNNDTILTAGWLPPLLDRMSSPPYPTAIGPLLLYPALAGKNDRIQHLGIVFEPQFHPFHLYEGFPADHPVCAKVRRFQALTGAAMLISRESFLTTGLFNEAFINGGEDVEFGVRLTSKGKIFLCEPKSKIYHLASQTPGIHAHAEHNANALKKQALDKILPDMHLFAKEDGYELALTPSLGVYLDMPARRKELLMRQVDRLKEAEELEDFLAREPLCHYGYHTLATRYADSGQFEKTASTLFLALKMCKHPETAKKILTIPTCAQDDEARRYAFGILDWYKRKNFTEIHEKAVFMAAFMGDLNIPSLRLLYETWGNNKERMRTYYG